MTLSWDAPIDNCDGSPLTDLDHYELPIFRAVIMDFVPCVPGEPGLCPVYSRALTRIVVRDPPEITIANPALGEVLGYEWPEAIDVAGNSSAQCEGAP